MPDEFTLTFDYKGKPLEMPCMLRVSRYTYQIICSHEDMELVIERDDEGNLRVLAADPFSTSQSMDSGLIKAILQEVERILQ